MIEVKNINQSYTKHGKKKILENINLTVKEKAITALIGSNGAGKSTLLGVMSNLIAPLSGEVLIDGTDIRSIKPCELAKKIAVLKQTQHINIRITVEDLVEFGRFPHSKGRLNDFDRKKVKESLAYMSLTGLENRYLDELSGGQRQRAFIAMILAQDTPYIFLDEPLNNLDIKYSVEMMKVIRSLVTELGKTVIVVLHDINFASAYADYIVAMKKGRIIGEGHPDQVITKEVLDKVFDHDFNIVSYQGRNTCLYFDCVS
ncbi:MAG: ATP-binding cassette domain-containing protein [Clostridiaceae bacterium]|nr:ATP-binding cassette domain-containing protein [Clostridiaceae bacterium]